MRFTASPCHTEEGTAPGTLGAARDAESPTPAWCGALGKTRAATACRSVLGGRGCGGVDESVGLVVDVNCDLAELVAVLSGVVCAEEEVAGTGELHAQVGLCTATVAAVQSRQRVTGGYCSGHLRPLSFRGALLNVATHLNVPRIGWGQSLVVVLSHVVQTSNHAGHFPNEGATSRETG